MSVRFLSAVLFLALPALLLADDWPQWRGPTRNGISQETGLLQKWPEAGPPLVWQITDVGSGFSTPSVVGDRIYLLGNEGMDNEFVQARDVKTGDLIWQQRIGRVGKNEGPFYPGARSTPTVVGDFLYALGSNSDLACLKTKDGSIVWTTNLKKDFGGNPGRWAYAESPLVDGEILVCTPGGEEATLLALDRDNGEVIWKCALPTGDEAGYSSAMIMNAGGTKQYVQFLQKGVVGIAATNGKLLWRYERTAKGSLANIATPLVKNDRVYTASARGGAALIAIKSNNGKFTTEEVYYSQSLPDNIGGSVVHDGHLFGTTRQGLMCVDFKTGEVLWKDRAIGPASTLYADGLLFLHGENGEVLLVQATTDSYNELGHFTPQDAPDTGKAKTWAYPVLSDGKLYIRQKNSLWSYNVAK